MFFALLVVQVIAFGLFVGVLGYYFGVYRMRRNVRIRMQAAQEEARRLAMQEWEHERYLLRHDPRREPPEEAKPTPGPAEQVADFEGHGGWKQGQASGRGGTTTEREPLRRTGT